MAAYKGGVIGNRFEITDKLLIVDHIAYHGVTSHGREKTTIPLRNIASAVHPPRRNEVIVQTNDGKSITLVDMHPDDAIAALLS
ncbi:MAG TPA: hypothetical protein VNF73_10930 [Candidatus Saccharimonadales bacterium]|nr:hypothetical protein [Candidatus Saccharimonadales bacterium]